MDRNLTIDIIKIISAFLVVGLHGFIFADVDDFLCYIFVNGITRIAVPLFLLINGFYFYQITSFEKLKVLLKRVFYLYLIWFILYIYLWYNPNISIGKIALSFLVGPWHLWYLIASLYAFIIIWFLKDIKFKIQVVIIIICAVMGIVLQYIYNYYPSLHDLLLFRIGGIHLFRNSIFFCLPFIYIGFIINKFNMSINQPSSEIILFFIIGFILLLVEASINYHLINDRFDILLSLYIVCPCIFIFGSSKKIISHNKQLALLSSGVYLTHIAIFSLPIRQYFHLSNTQNVIITFCLSIFVSFFLILVKRKIKYII